MPRASGDQRLKREVAELRRADESSRRRLLSSRPSSTAPLIAREVHGRARRPQRRWAALGSQGDLRRAVPAPSRTRVADFTYGPTWSGMVYVAYVLDAYSRRIGAGGRPPACTPRSCWTLEQAVWTRCREGVAGLAGLIHHTDAGPAVN